MIEKISAVKDPKLLEERLENYRKLALAEGITEAAVISTDQIIIEIGRAHV